ncbi:CDP-glycerol--glycerophosphate glycerophosphotransferase, partial [Sulfurovum sp. bin170]|uniref:CDP-glycerol glycerophosphotransferase family protein n=1 Tax=Sulfurovum sp. bin170 TaxID=2695268 RepID=UPI0013DEFBEE
MKTILFCNLPYAFSIMKPLADELEKRGDEYLWYITPELFNDFPYKQMMHSNSLEHLKDFKADAIFVPGDDVPYWLRGVKAQIFHGLAGEKEEYFDINGYFDLYLTQGPYFTERFEELSLKYKNFTVTETGWSKLDNFFAISDKTKEKKEQLLTKYSAKHIVLYAPSSSSSLTSAVVLKDVIKRLSSHKDILFMIKFAESMDEETIEAYRELDISNIMIVEDDITQIIQIADLLLSDTSSVVYEFIFLDKPVITFNSLSENITWSNHTDINQIFLNVVRTLEGNDRFKDGRGKTMELYHPYRDGASSKRMIEAIEAYIKEHGVPESR